MEILSIILQSLSPYPHLMSRSRPLQPHPETTPILASDELLYVALGGRSKGYIDDCYGERMICLLSLSTAQASLSLAPTSVLTFCNSIPRSDKAQLLASVCPCQQAVDSLSISAVGHPESSHRVRTRLPRLRELGKKKVGIERTHQRFRTTTRVVQGTASVGLHGSGDY